MAVKIVQKDDKVLRQTAIEVPLSDISTPKIKKVITDMKRALAGEDDGVAIAAPQIGVPLRIFVVSGRAIGFIKGEKEGENIYPDIVYINPTIIKYSKEKSTMEEGCLSVRYLYGKVSRSKKVTIQSFDENGKFSKKGAVGLMAQIYQHEVDHLNGILFTDKAKEVEEIPPEVMRKRSRISK